MSPAAIAAVCATGTLAIAPLWPSSRITRWLPAGTLVLSGAVRGQRAELGDGGALRALHLDHVARARREPERVDLQGELAAGSPDEGRGALRHGLQLQLRDRRRGRGGGEPVGVALGVGVEADRDVVVVDPEQLVGRRAGRLARRGG